MKFTEVSFPASTSPLSCPHHRPPDMHSSELTARSSPTRSRQPFDPLLPLDPIPSLVWIPSRVLLSIATNREFVVLRHERGSRGSRQCGSWREVDERRSRRCLEFANLVRSLFVSILRSVSLEVSPKCHEGKGTNDSKIAKRERVESWCCDYEV